jgi:NADH:ubiquinone oxidoreductase subunit C
MMETTLKVEAVKDALGDLGAVEAVRWNRVKVTTTPDKVREGILRAESILGCDHLVQIAAVDNGKTFDLIYHLTGSHRMVVALAIELPRDRPEAPTTSDLLPPAGIYERQIHDLLGITFRGHPGLKRIILNEDWPENQYPLRKDWKMDPNRFYGGVHEEVK